MKNKKILIIIPIILVILLLIGVGVGAFVYFTTDIFKSPKQLFFKYVGKTFETSEEFDYDKFLEEYKTQSEKSYKSSGEMNVEINTDISEAKDVKEALSKAKLTYTLNTIPTQEKSYISIGATYNNNEITKFEGLAVENNYGLKCADVYNKYIYVENNNLKALAKKFGINSSSFPDKFEKVDTYDFLYVSKDTREKVKDTYYNLLDEKLNKKMFSTEKNVETTVNGETLKTNAYSLTVNEIELYDILISVLETLKNDDTTLDLIMEKVDAANIKDTIEQSISSFSSSSIYGYTTSSSQTVTFDKEYLKDSIQDLIDDLEDEKTTASTDNTLKLTVYTSKGNTVKLELTATNATTNDLQVSSIEITKNKNSNNIISLILEGETVLKIEYTESKENNVEKSSGTITITSDDVTVPINFNIESGKDSTKTNVKATLPLEDTLGTSQTYFDEDIVIEFNSDITGELGKGTNNTTSYLSISSGEHSIKLNVKEDITYTDDISIDNLNSSNGVCLNDMSVSQIESLLEELATNQQKVLPSKLELLGIDTSTLTDDTNTDDEDITNTTTENTSNTITNSTIIDDDDDNDTLIPF